MGGGRALDAVGTAGEWGQKIVNLSRLASSGLPVLPGYCVRPDDLSDGDGLEAVSRWASEHSLEELFVRSSLQAEDDEARTGTGIGLSAELASADLARPGALDPWTGQKGLAALLFQPLLRGPWGGVAFVDGAHCRIEAGFESMSLVTRGGVPDAVVSVFPDGSVVCSGQKAVMFAAELWRLYEQLIAAFVLFGRPADIEWGLTADQSFLLQIRPITRPSWTAPANEH